MSASHATVFEHPAVSRQRLRQRLSRLIDRLLCALDEIDGDPDLESTGDDEPCLSAVEDTLKIGPTTFVLSQVHIANSEPLGGDDREEEDEHDEASLCGITYGHGDKQDREHEHDGREASLSGTLGTYAHAVGPGETGISSLGEITWDLEGQCEDEGHDSDRELEEGE